MTSLISRFKNMRLAFGMAILGVSLGVVAVYGLISQPAEFGDATAVEASLTGRLTSTTPATPTTSITTPGSGSSTVATVAEQPRWEANDISLFSEMKGAEAPRPSRLLIAALAVDAPIGEYGVAPNGQMDVPGNVTEVGWYRYGPAPGENGSAVLAAHVDLEGRGRGLFFELDQLQPDDRIEIVYTDGSSKEFAVAARSKYEKDSLPLDVIFSRDGDPVLTLVTCGGGFSRSSRQYDSNVVVYAVPVPDQENRPEGVS